MPAQTTPSGNSILTKVLAETIEKLLGRARISPVDEVLITDRVRPLMGPFGYGIFLELKLRLFLALPDYYIII